MGNGGSAAAWNCDYDGDGKGEPFTSDPKQLRLVKMEQPVQNHKACTNRSSGSDSTMYNNGEFVVDGVGGGCLNRRTGGPPDERCKNGGMPGGCSSGLCGPAGCCYNGNEPQFRRKFFLASAEHCILTKEGIETGLQPFNGLFRTCDPDWQKPDNVVNQTTMKKYCATATLEDPLCKTFCATYPEMCISHITTRCNSEDALGRGICNDLCNTKPKNSNVAGACSKVVSDVCANNTLNSAVCQKLCFDSTTDYDCKTQLTAYCKDPEHQTNAMCACFLPPENYRTFYGKLFANVADPNVAGTLQAQAQALPQCSYPECSTQEKFKPRVVEVCPSQQTCIAQIVNINGVATYNGNNSIRQDCNLLTQSLNTKPETKERNAIMIALTASAAATPAYNVLKNSSITAAGSYKPSDYSAICLNPKVYNEADLAEPQHRKRCTDAIENFCGASAENLESGFCRDMCAKEPGIGPIHDACAAAVSKVCNPDFVGGSRITIGGVNTSANLISEACKTMCFSESTTYDCTAKLEAFCATGITNEICDCHKGQAYYRARFVEMLTHAKEGAGKTQLTALTVGKIDASASATPFNRALYDYTLTSVNHDCWNSNYYPRSMNPPAAAYQATDPINECIVQLEVSHDIHGEDTLVYHGEIDKSGKDCIELVKSLNTKPAIPDSHVGTYDNPNPDGVHDWSPEPEPDRPHHSNVGLIAIVVVIIVIVAVLKWRSTQSTASSDVALTYEQAYQPAVQPYQPAVQPYQPAVQTYQQYPQQSF